MNKESDIDTVNDSRVSISELKERVQQFVKDRKWLSYHHPKELAISIAIEAAELLEIFQWEDKEPLEDMRKDEGLTRRVRDELADVCIYALCMANQMHVDLAHAVQEKIKKNEDRYSVADVLKTGRYRKDKTRKMDQ